MDHILNLIEKRQKEVQLAKAKLVQPPREVAQLVVYMDGHNGQPMVVRFVDAKVAIKQFKALAQSIDKEAESITITGPASTMVIMTPARRIDAFFLVDVDANNTLMADSQKRINAMMQT